MIIIRREIAIIEPNVVYCTALCPWPNKRSLCPMAVLKPLTFKFKQGDTDTAGRSLQVLDTVHRSTLINIVRGKPLAGRSDFKDPTGIFLYNGFGADGVYYTAGTPGRTWTQRQCIDDFTDKVTDADRWDAIVNDFIEGGLENFGATPFGDRLYAEYGEGAPRGGGPDQGRLQMEGNAYLKAEFPKLDYVVKATILTEGDAEK